MTNHDFLNTLRVPTESDPLRVLLSACLLGSKCGYDGSSNGTYPSTLKLFDYNNINLVSFCPEEFSFGTPREMCDIHGGNGFDVLDGTAKVLTESGIDWSEKMILAARKMVQIAQKEDIELAIMMDISAACGSQVIYDGNRFAKDPVYQIGSGVCAALLIRNGFTVVSQRDFASLEILYSKLSPDHKINSDAIDHHKSSWYQQYFNIKQ